MRSFVDKHLFSQVDNSPLIVFRIIFGILMFISLFRFYAMGWVEEFYIKPDFHFRFYGFEWVPIAGETGIYLIFWIALVSSLFIALGFLYRYSSILFFLSYTYLELIESSLYLNHYYLISLLGFMLIFLPASDRFSLDTRFGIIKRTTKTFSWTINIIRLQLVLVYFFAGVAKIQPDWLFEAQPLKIWLTHHSELPLIGDILNQNWTAYFFAWFGCIYDLLIGFLLLISLTRKWAYLFVVIFHLATGFLFNIGLFPYIMIALTLVFFNDIHIRILNKLDVNKRSKIINLRFSKKLITIPIIIYFFIQIILPLRHFLFEGNVLWTEQGYRFSWRVKLVAKYGEATFYVEDRATKRRIEIKNENYLEPIQIKKMSVKPELILQFAHHLNKTFQDTIIQAGDQKFHLKTPRIFADVFVSFNGRSSIRLINPEIDLSTIKSSQIEYIILNKIHPFDQ